MKVRSDGFLFAAAWVILIKLFWNDPWWQIALMIVGVIALAAFFNWTGWAAE